MPYYCNSRYSGVLEYSGYRVRSSMPYYIWHTGSMPAFPAGFVHLLGTSTVMAIRVPTRVHVYRYRYAGASSSMPSVMPVQYGHTRTVHSEYCIIVLLQFIYTYWY